MVQTFGRLKAIDGNKVTVNLDDLTDGQRSLITKNRGSIVELDVSDGRTISAAQRGKIYSMINEIDKWMGNFNREMTKKYLKAEYVIENNVFQSFSLSNCSLTQANDFIEWLIVFCLNNNVEFKTKLLDSIKGNYGWELHCLEAHVCCICGKPAQYAHWYAVGIGRNRNKIDHVGNYIMGLCAQHHSEQHTIGLITFIELYHLKGVKITADLAQRLRLESEKTYQSAQNKSNYEYERQKSVNMYGNTYEYLED